MDDFSSFVQSTSYPNIYLSDGVHMELVSQGFSPVSTEISLMQQLVDALGFPEQHTKESGSVLRAAEHEATKCRTHPVTLYTVAMAILMGHGDPTVAPHILLVGPPGRIELVFEAAERVAEQIWSNLPRSEERMALPTLMGMGFLSTVPSSEAVVVSVNIPDRDGVERYITLNLPESFTVSGSAVDAIHPDVVWDVDSGEVNFLDTDIADALVEIVDSPTGHRIADALAESNDIDSVGYRTMVAALTLYAETESDPRVHVAGDRSAAMRHLMVSVLCWNVVNFEKNNSGMADHDG